MVVRPALLGLVRRFRSARARARFRSRFRDVCAGSPANKSARRVDALGGVLRGLFRGLLLHALAAIQDGKVVVRGKIVGIDGLQCLELLHRLVAAMLLVVGDAKLAARIAGFGILRDDLLQVGDLSLGMARSPLHQRHVVERPSIVRMSASAFSSGARASAYFSHSM